MERDILGGSLEGHQYWYAKDDNVINANTVHRVYILYVKSKRQCHHSLSKCFCLICPNSMPMMQDSNAVNRPRRPRRSYSTARCPASSGSVCVCVCVSREPAIVRDQLVKIDSF